jgi:hypothetical protein
VEMPLTSESVEVGHVRRGGGGCDDLEVASAKEHERRVNFLPN